MTDRFFKDFPQAGLEAPVKDVLSVSRANVVEIGREFLSRHPTVVLVFNLQGNLLFI